jgi:hypothetical protein
VSTLTFTKWTVTDENEGYEPAIVEALRSQYTLADCATVYTATTPLGESAVMFLDQDGSGLLLLSRDPAAFVKAVCLVVGETAYDTLMALGAPQEWELEPGTFDPKSDQIQIKTGMEL